MISKNDIIDVDLSGFIGSDKVSIARIDRIEQKTIQV